MGKYQRDKGANFERTIANLFKEQGFNARRGGFAQAQNSTNEPDVIVDDLPGLWIECKKGARTFPIAALKQAREAGGPTSIPIAVCQDDYDKATVTCELDFFLVLLKSFCLPESEVQPTQTVKEEPKEVPKGPQQLDLVEQVRQEAKEYDE